MTSLIDWLRNYKDPLTLLMNVGTLVVWILYAQLLLNNYQRQRRPRIIINRGAGKGIGSLCLISNMSAEPIFINQIILQLDTNKGRLWCDITDIREERLGEVEQDLILQKATRQGPLRTGEFTHIGTFSTLLKRMAASHNIELRGHEPAEGWSFKELEIRVIAFYGSDKHAIGARRAFRLGDADEGGWELLAVSRESQQFNSRWQRRTVRRQWQMDSEN